MSRQYVGDKDLSAQTKDNRVDFCDKNRFQLALDIITIRHGGVS